MSLLEAGPRYLRKKKPRRRRQYTPPLDKDIATGHPDQILLFIEWCQLNRISESTGRRILAGDGGPVVTALSKTRIGITVGNNAAWQKSRVRK